MRPVPRFSEDARQLVHVATGVAALLLRPGIVNNDVLNFLNTAIAAAAAVLIAKSVA
jgi:uncharacterized membrane protein